MSAASRAYDRLADHFERLAAQHAADFPPGSPPIYDGVRHFELAADMCRRTALDERWRGRMEPDRVRRALRRLRRRVVSR